MSADPLLLARAQFGLNICIPYPVPHHHHRTGMVSALPAASARIAAAKHGSSKAYRLWVKIFALSFGLGVVSGRDDELPVRHELAWFMEKAGNVAGPLLGYEVLMPSSLKRRSSVSCSSARDHIPQWMHTLAASLVAIGTTASAFLDPRPQLMDAGHRKSFALVDGEGACAELLQIIFTRAFRTASRTC